MHDVVVYVNIGMLYKYTYIYIYIYVRGLNGVKLN